MFLVKQNILLNISPFKNTFKKSSLNWFNLSFLFNVVNEQNKKSSICMVPLCPNGCSILLWLKKDLSFPWYLPKGSTGTSCLAQLLSGYGSWAQASVPNVLKSLRNSVSKEKLLSVEQMQLMQRYFLEFAESLEERSLGYFAQLIKRWLAGQPHCSTGLQGNIRKNNYIYNLTIYLNSNRSRTYSFWSTEAFTSHSSYKRYESAELTSMLVNAILIHGTGILAARSCRGGVVVRKRWFLRHPVLRHCFITREPLIALKYGPHAALCYTGLNL